jgi:hypothetical protein
VLRLFRWKIIIPVNFSRKLVNLLLRLRSFEFCTSKFNRARTNELPEITPSSSPIKAMSPKEFKQKEVNLRGSISQTSCHASLQKSLTRLDGAGSCIEKSKRSCLRNTAQRRWNCCVELHQTRPGTEDWVDRVIGSTKIEQPNVRIRKNVSCSCRVSRSSQEISLDRNRSNAWFGQIRGFKALKEQ